MWEPRGHLVMFGAVVVLPADQAADLGLVFMDGGGAVEMCVHGTIGAVTALVETGPSEDAPRWSADGRHSRRASARAHPPVEVSRQRGRFRKAFQAAAWRRDCVRTRPAKWSCRTSPTAAT